MDRCQECVVKKGTNDDIKKADEYLRTVSPKYADYVKQLQVWSYYDTLKNDESSKYFIGIERANSWALFPIKLTCLIKRLLRR